MRISRIVEGEPGIFPPGPGQLLRWLRERRARRRAHPAAEPDDGGRAAPTTTSGPSPDPAADVDPT